MTEIKLLITALSASFILQCCTILIAVFLKKNQDDIKLSVKLLRIIAIENYTFCEKALCQMVQFTAALFFISVYEWSTYENHAESSFFPGLIFAIGGIVILKFLFSSLFKVFESNNFISFTK